jgi:GDP-mannose 4,6-dehydratase
MDNLSKNINKCRICKSIKLSNVISLGEQYITSRFPLYGDWDFPKVEVDLCLCGECNLLQMVQTTLSKELYENEYGYRSGINNTMKNHLKDYNKEIQSIVVELTHEDIILDIGSNDSTMLNFYPKENKNLVGIDPTGLQFKKYYNRAFLIPDYFTKDNFNKNYGKNIKKCKIVSSISMFYDLPDPVQFAKDVYEILDEDGIWTCEQSYLLSMLKRNSIDTICHEHLEYYSLKQIKFIADRTDFKIINVMFNDCNGGSFRVYLSKKNSFEYTECFDLINKILKEEEDFGLNKKETYENFLLRCDNEVNKLNNLLDTINSNGMNTYIYGASTKGNCLLQYANIDESIIKYAVERNLDKVGKMTNTGIEIINEETMRKDPPNYLLILPYHFKEEIIVRESEFLKNGGQLIFPLPVLDVVSYSKKVLITGCDGHISYYVKELFKLDKEKYSLYGIGHLNEKYEKNVLKYYFDMSEYKMLYFVLDILKPDIVIHLASISNSSEAFNNPIKTLEINGMSCVNLCYIIYETKMKTILFNASSSEMYKGHEVYNIEDNDTHKYHLHPYSIAKIMAHNMIDFYRENYNLPFSNGILFTTESKYKKKSFLLNKVSEHIKIWKKTKDVLKLGSLGSYRNIIHASDVASAIEKIVNCNKPDNYLICNENSYKVFELVEYLYSLENIYLYEKIIDDKLFYYDKTTNMCVIEISNEKIGYDVVDTNISGKPDKLKSIGWKPVININKILKEIFYG